MQLGHYRKNVLGTLLREKDKLPKKNLIDRLSHIHQRVMCATNHLKVEHFVSNGYIHKYYVPTTKLKQVRYLHMRFKLEIVKTDYSYLKI